MFSHVTCTHVVNKCYQSVRIEGSGESVRKNEVFIVVEFVVMGFLNYW